MKTTFENENSRMLLNGGTEQFAVIIFEPEW